MGNYNCKECLDKDYSVMNEMLLNTSSYNKETNQENLRNTRSERIKVLKTNNSDKEIINLEENNQSSKVSSQSPITKTKKQKNFSHNILRKEEKDNNILLKNELNKIKEMNNVSKNLNQKKLTNNKNQDDFNKIIESQRKQIIAQEKIIAEYKNKQSLLEEQKKILEQTQKKIQEQQFLLNEQYIENKKTYMVHPPFPYEGENNFKYGGAPEIKTSQTDMINSNSKQKIVVSKSTPKLKIKTGKKNFNQNYNNNINNINMNIPDIKKFERTQVIKPNFINFNKIMKEKENEHPEKWEENKENQIEENDNYERVDDNDLEEENKILRYSHPQSKRFKIETYEPIEPGNKNENDEVINNINNLFENKDIILEPRDSTKLSLRKAVIPKSNLPEKNINKERYSKKKKKESGPKDNNQAQTGININFRGTFENENINKKSIKKNDIEHIMNFNQLGPRDSRRKEEIEFSYNLKKENNKKNNNNSNNTPFILSNEDIIRQNFNNNINDNDNEEINEVLIQQQEQFNNENLFQNNNIYFSNEYNINNNQQESPKFNSKYNEDINTTDKNTENYGPYLTQFNDINTAMPTIPFIYNDNDPEKQFSQTLNDVYRPNLNNIDNGLNNLGIIENNDINNNNIENPLMYSVDKINTNFYENKNEFYQE